MDLALVGLFPVSCWMPSTLFYACASVTIGIYCSSRRGRCQSVVVSGAESLDDPNEAVPVDAFYLVWISDERYNFFESIIWKDSSLTLYDSILILENYRKNNI